MFLCCTIAFVCIAPSFAVAMSPLSAITKALEALNMINPSVFVSFLKAIPQELRLIMQAVVEEYRMTISESPMAFPLMRLENAKYAASLNTSAVAADAMAAATADTSAALSVTLQTPVATAVKKLAQATARPMHIPVRTATIDSAPIIRDPTYTFTEDMMVILGTLLVLYLAVKLYTYSCGVCSKALEPWKKANAASLVGKSRCTQFSLDDSTTLGNLSPSEIFSVFTELRAASRMTGIEMDTRSAWFKTPTFHHASTVLAELWTAYVASNDVNQDICPEAWMKTLLSPGDSSDSSRDNSLNRCTPAFNEPKEMEFAVIAGELEAMASTLSPNETISPYTETVSSVQQVQTYMHCVRTFETSVEQSKALMLRTRDSMSILEKLEAGCIAQEDRKAPQLSERINATTDLILREFRFNEQEFYRLMGFVHKLCTSKADHTKPESQLIDGASEHLCRFMGMKGTVLTRLLEECLSINKECEALKSLCKDIN